MREWTSVLALMVLFSQPIAAQEVTKEIPEPKVMLYTPHLFIEPKPPTWTDRHPRWAKLKPVISPAVNFVMYWFLGRRQ